MDAAADFAALDAFGLLSVLLAALAAFAELSFVVLRWASADPAADFAPFDALVERSVFDAALAADFPVFSEFFLVIMTS